MARTSTQDPHVIPSIRRSHFSDVDLSMSVEDSESTGSSTPFDLKDELRGVLAQSSLRSLDIAGIKIKRLV
jgi:hypothetical protein